ncbi:hypothetical protein F5148DRAFT_1154182 [Russula earlei]|uniref:Uncharacterized protein n=1 Tax=Russula earlei TaxID=71964 RepID=A0ACC0TS04_9AGAM|nr:hypothetical protein F5148DRAFT_1154182 [Russula earlei]
MLWLSLWPGPSWSSGVVLMMRGGDGAVVLVLHKTTTKAAGAETKAEGETRKAAPNGAGATIMAVDEATDETEGDEMTEGIGADEMKAGVADEAVRAEVVGGAKTLVGEAEAKVVGIDEVATMVDAGDAGLAEAGGAGGNRRGNGSDMKAMMGDAGTMAGAGVGMG